MDTEKQKENGKNKRTYSTDELSKLGIFKDDEENDSSQ
jgi:hypothetical protein